jgi:hypothetical protein
MEENFTEKISPSFPVMIHHVGDEKFLGKFYFR